MWLCSIAKHLWHKELEKKERETVSEVVEEVYAAGKSAEVSAIQKAEVLELYKILHSLEEPLREVMYLRLNGDFTFREIGEIMGRNESWARVTFYRGKQKIKKKNRRKTAGIFAGAILVVGIMGILLLSQMISRVKYDDVKLTCGVRGNTAYYTMESKPGYELHFTGSSGGKKSHLKVLSMRKIGDSQPDTMGWEDEVGTEENPCVWTIEFQDKTIVIENGKLVQEEENQ